MKESIETLKLVLWFDMTLDRTKSERFQRSVCMLSASCICMINERQPSSQDLCTICLIHQLATERLHLALPCKYVLLALVLIHTATILARLWVSSAGLPSLS